jgi:hypothetical protein
MKPVALLLCALAISGCTRDAWYAGTQQSAENRCRQQPGDAAQRCLENLKKQRYPEYEKERTGEKAR